MSKSFDLFGQTLVKCNMDGKHFPMKEYQVGLTAPPFHPNCRGTTCPYFDDEYGTRVGRDENGDTIEFRSDMNYEHWKKIFVDNADESDIISNRKELLKKINDGSMTLEINEDTQARHMYETYIAGRSYFNQGITYDDLQTILKENYGTGHVRISSNGQIKETFDYGKPIAVAVDLNNGEGTETSRITVHYSKKRTHLVPSKG